MKIKLSTYSTGQQLPAHCFFILNKGMNAGKPADTPWANCFIAEFDTLEERDYYFWICYGLRIIGKFRQYIIGTSVPFIRKDDLLRTIGLADCAMHDRKDLFMESIGMLYEAQEHSRVLTERVNKLEKSKNDIVKLFVFV